MPSTEDQRSRVQISKSKGPTGLELLCWWQHHQPCVVNSEDATARLEEVQTRGRGEGREIRSQEKVLKNRKRTSEWEFPHTRAYTQQARCAKNDSASNAPHTSKCVCCEKPEGDLQ